MNLKLIGIIAVFGLYSGIANSSSTILTNQLGDADGFGLGLTEGDIKLPPSNFDNRDTDDPRFTDVWPQPVDSSGEKFNEFSYVHDLGSDTFNVTSAKLTWLTLGIQDGDNQVYQSNTDIRLFIDNVEVENAFDDVDQFDQYDGVWAQSVGKVEILIPDNLLYLLNDGIVEIKFRTEQLGALPNIDGYALDYSLLTITNEDTDVSIDIKPGTFPNAINIKNKGRTPVAILTTDASDNLASFDASTVEPTTVILGSAAPVHDALEDVDLDGDDDMILLFNTQDIDINCGDTSTTLIGSTYDGELINGTDSIVVVGCNK